MAKIRLMIVDDHPIVRAGLRRSVELETDIQVVGEASDGAEAVIKAHRLDPHVVLMDVRMPTMSGIEACRAIKSRKPDVSVLMVTSFDDEEAIVASSLAGASGYLLKRVGLADLLKAIRFVATGQSLLDPNMTKQAIARRITTLTTSGVGTQMPGNALTERELEVLKWITCGYTNKQIADVLCITAKTARNHVSRILEKLGVARRSEAAARAIEDKLVPPREPEKDGEW